jgi:hypothetical protein
MALIFITPKGFITTLNIGIKTHNTSTRTNKLKLRLHSVQSNTAVCKSTQQHTAHHIVMIMPYQLKTQYFEYYNIT